MKPIVYAVLILSVFFLSGCGTTQSSTKVRFNPFPEFYAKNTESTEFLISELIEEGKTRSEAIEFLTKQKTVTQVETRTGRNSEGGARVTIDKQGNIQAVSDPTRTRVTPTETALGRGVFIFMGMAALCMIGALFAGFIWRDKRVALYLILAAGINAGFAILITRADAFLAGWPWWAWMLSGTAIAAFIVYAIAIKHGYCLRQKQIEKGDDNL